MFQLEASRTNRKGDPKSEARKPTSQSARLGQVKTPSNIADQMSKSFLSILSGRSVLDPCVGGAIFPAAIVNNSVGKPLDFTLVDIDKMMTQATRDWAQASGASVNIITGDYLTMRMDNQFDGVIFNPPFVRQEWIGDKEAYRSRFKEWWGISIPGTSNLYVYFVAKAIQDLKSGGIILCIIYDSWRSTLFGRWLSQYLQENCTELEIKEVPTPFESRLINATILTGKKTSDLEITARSPEIGWNLDYTSSRLKGIANFTPLTDLFSTRRGLRLKQFSFFITRRPDIRLVGALPFVKKIGNVRGFAVPEDHDEAALLMDKPDPQSPIYAKLTERLRKAYQNPDSNLSILTWHKERPLTWYIHRKPPYAPILFNYYIRHRPRHLFNPCFFYSDNFYGLVPLRDQLSAVGHLAILNCTAVAAEILNMSSDQGSGLSKVQLHTYRQVYVPDTRVLSSTELRAFEELGARLKSPSEAPAAIDEIDRLVREYYLTEAAARRTVDKLVESVNTRRLRLRGR